MKLTQTKLKELILEVLEGESGIDDLIKSGKWDFINQALTLTVDVGLPLEELPWELLPIDTMVDGDLMSLGQYILENGYLDGDDIRPKRMLKTGIMGMSKDTANPIFKSTGKSKYRQFVEAGVKKALGLKLRN
tara:strand:- start:3 stop:401 length:399 start_codon:yes stop_codon:yes gene_type:complete